MIAKSLYVLFFFLLVVKSNAQLVFNLQYGKGISFSQRAGGMNDNGLVKIFPYTGNTWGLGAGYRLSPKLTFLFSATLNSHGWEVKMRDSVNQSYKSYRLRYNGSRYVYQYKISALYAIYSKNNFKLNFTGGVGAFCTRCIFYRPRWSGITNSYQSTHYLGDYPDSYIIVFKKDMKNYTFINTYFTAGAEILQSYKKHEFGFFTDVEIALGKNFDHRVGFVRGSQWGHIDVRNRGAIVRFGLFLRPYFSLTKKAM